LFCVATFCFVSVCFGCLCRKICVSLLWILLSFFLLCYTSRWLTLPFPCSHESINQMFCRRKSRERKQIQVAYSFRVIRRDEFKSFLQVLDRLLRIYLCFFFNLYVGEADIFFLLPFSSCWYIVVIAATCLLVYLSPTRRLLLLDPNILFCENLGHVRLAFILYLLLLPWRASFQRWMDISTYNGENGSRAFFGGAGGAFS